MRVNAILVFCAHVCFVQSVFGQCFGRAGVTGPGFMGPGLYGVTIDPGCGVSSTGGGFAVTSASPVPPTGLNVLSENLYEGSLLVEGNLPLLGSVGLEGALGTAGAGAVSYGCGDGAIDIVEEGPIVTGIVTSGATGPGLSIGSLAPALTYGPGLGYGMIGAGIGPGCGCGYNAIY